MKKLLQLFLTFFKIGGFTFGGGHAMIPLIQRETVENRKWVTDDDILEIIAIAESTPGPVAINAATFVGYRTAGFWGAAAAASAARRYLAMIPISWPRQLYLRWKNPDVISWISTWAAPCRRSPIPVMAAA